MHRHQRDPDGFGKEEAFSYSGPTHISVRSEKYASFIADTHAYDFETLLSVKPLMMTELNYVKSVIIIFVDRWWAGRKPLLSEGQELCHSIVVEEIQPGQFNELPTWENEIKMPYSTVERFFKSTETTLRA